MILYISCHFCWNCLWWQSGTHHNMDNIFSWQILLIFSTLHSSHTVILFATFQQDSSPVMDVNINWDVVRFLLKRYFWGILSIVMTPDISCKLPLYTWCWELLLTAEQFTMTGAASMMTSSNGNIFHVTGPLCREFTNYSWIPLIKASDVALWGFLWSAPE